MKMRVMVVEDEPPIQRSVCQKIEETNEIFEVVAAIDNGKEAIQYLENHPVDVMFVDMNLPIVSGKELLEYATTENIGVMPVVLSGYTDFEYVKCALSNHAIDYLLKPLKNSELKLVLNRIENKIRKRQFEEKVQNLEDAINGLESTKTDRGNQDICQAYCMLLMSFGGGYGYLGENERNYAEIFRSLKLEEKLSGVVPEGNFWLVDGKNMNEKLIFIRKGSEPEVNRLNQIFQSLKCPSLTFTVVYYKDAVELEDIFPVYRLLQKYTRDHMIFLKDSVLVYGPEDLCREFTDWRKEIDKMVLQCSNGEVEKINEVFVKLLHLLTVRPITQKEALRDIKYFISKLYRIQPGHRGFFEVEEDIQFILENYYKEEDIQKEFSFLLRDTFGVMMSDSRDKKVLALQMKKYLDENFRTNITNQFLTERFGFVPSYLGGIFKTHYGMTPIDYLVKKRIDEAKLLLENSDMKIKDIANNVGYEDSLYFSKVFKKMTGISPKEYMRLQKEE